jgi:Uma2 family endonuclease
MPLRALIDMPEIEYLDGEAHPKVSPKVRHGVVQFAMARILYAASGNRGTVGTEIHFYPGKAEKDATFVPDAAYIATSRLEALPPDLREEPPFSPDIAIEVRSPSIDVRYLAHKIERYLATGAMLVLDVDPYARTIVAHTSSDVRTFAEPERFETDAFDWFRFDVSEAFADLDRLP